MRSAVLFLALAACAQPETKVYATCRCRPDVVGCVDSVTQLVGNSTERCARGATLEVVRVYPPQCSGERDARGADGGGR